MQTLEALKALSLALVGTAALIALMVLPQLIRAL